MLGTGFIADFYTSTLHNQRGIDRVQAVYSRSKERAEAFQSKWNVMHGSDNLEETVSRDDIDTVIIGLPNHRHEEAVLAAAKAGAVLCTKPLGRNATEAKRMLEAVQEVVYFTVIWKT